MRSESFDIVSILIHKVTNSGLKQEIILMNWNHNPNPFIPDFIKS